MRVKKKNKTTQTTGKSKRKGEKGGKTTSITKDIQQITNENTPVGRADVDDIPEYGEEDYKES